jgi:hypothetical protein
MHELPKFAARVLATVAKSQETLLYLFNHNLTERSKLQVAMSQEMLVEKIFVCLFTPVSAFLCM